MHGERRVCAGFIPVFVRVILIVEDSRRRDEDQPTLCLAVVSGVVETFFRTVGLRMSAGPRLYGTKGVCWLSVFCSTVFHRLDYEHCFSPLFLLISLFCPYLFFYLIFCKLFFFVKRIFFFALLFPLRVCACYIYRAGAY